jgi:hypothetical protein
MPIIISNIFSGTALSNAATVAARPGTRALAPVALSAVPWVLAAAAAPAAAASAQRRDALFGHIAGLYASAGALMAALPLCLRGGPAAGFAALCAATAAATAAAAPMMALVARLCLAGEAAAAMPIVNSAAVLGGVVGPLVTGAMINRLVPGRGGAPGRAREGAEGARLSTYLRPVPRRGPVPGLAAAPELTAPLPELPPPPAALCTPRAASPTFL